MSEYPTSKLSSVEREAVLAALALEKPAAERGKWLDAVCAGDQNLRQRLESLVAAQQSAAAPPDSPAEAGPANLMLDLADFSRDEGVAQTQGRYKLLEQIGEGGCGVVYVAEQTEPVRRQVAVKVIKPGMDTKAVVARFEAERQALAMMNHPNIAKVFGGGVTENGRAFFVMELVRGVRITDYCDQACLSVRERIDLFLQVCAAIQHAHQKGVIHRDIKPSNILVTRQEPHNPGVPMVIDFGIAKATEGRLTEHTVYTHLSPLIGTPTYMSPEQAQLGRVDIDTRSDIYSLGVLLYELLTGKTPFDAKELTGTGLDGMRQMIREKEPLRPSIKLASLEGEEATSTAHRCSTTMPKLVHAVRGDLDWIVLKCLEKERSRRYVTVNGLAADLRRHLSYEPVIARPPSAGYRFYKACQRHKVAFAAGGAVAGALLLGMGVSTWQAHEANKARIAEKGQRLRADAEKAEAHRLLYGANMSLAQQAWDQNNIARLRELLTETQDYPDRGFEWYYWQRQAHRALKTLPAHKRGVTAAFSADGTRVVTGRQDGLVYLWDAASGRRLATFRGYSGSIYSVAFSPNGEWIAAGGEALTPIIWEASSGRQVCTVKGHTGAVWSIAFSPDGKRFVTGSEDATAKVWDTATSEEILTLKGHKSRIWLVAFSSDGRLILTASHDQTAKIWDAASGRELVTLAGHNDTIWGAAFSPDGQRVVTGSGDKSAKVWDVSSGRELFSLQGHLAGVGPVAFSPDGRRIATGSADQTIKMWDANTGKELETLKGHTSWLISLTFSRDGRFILSGSQDETAKLWDTAASAGPLTIKAHRALIRAVAFSPDGLRIITASQDQTAKVFNAITGQELLTFEMPGDEFVSAAFSPDGRRIAAGTGGKSNVAKIWDAATGREVLTLKGHRNGVCCVTFSPDGHQVLTGSWDNSAKVWDATTGRELFSLTAHSQPLTGAVFSPDGRWIATSSTDSTARIWNAATGQELRTFRGHRASINSIALSPDGLRVATTGEDQTVKVWEFATAREIVTFSGHSAPVMSVAFSPDGKRIVTGGVDQSAKVWEIRSDLAIDKAGRELLTLKGRTDLTDLIYCVAFSPDGQRIATAGTDQTVKIWEAALPQQVAAWRNEEATDAQYVELLEKERSGEQGR